MPVSGEHDHRSSQYSDEQLLMLDLYLDRILTASYIPLMIEDKVLRILNLSSEKRPSFMIAYKSSLQRDIRPRNWDKPELVEQEWQNSKAFRDSLMQLGEFDDVIVKDMEGTPLAIITPKLSEGIKLSADFSNSYKALFDGYTRGFEGKIEESCFVAISEMFTGIRQAHKAYMQVLSVTNEVISHGCGGRVFTYADIKKHSLATRTQPTSGSRKFINLLAVGNLSDAEDAAMLEIDRYISDPTVSIDKVDRLIRSHIDLVLNSFGISLDEVWPNGFCARYIYSRIQWTVSFPAKKQLLHEFFCNVNDNVRSNDGHGDKVYQICDYINQNYTDVNLCASSIANAFGLNFSYLSDMFRKKLGVNLLDYIHKVRLDSAKDLLCSTNLSIDYIGQRCGYTDGASFGRIFKRYEAVPPGKFRQLSTELERGK